MPKRRSLPGQEPLRQQLIRSMATQLKPTEGSLELLDYWDDPLAFTLNCFRWQEVGDGHTSGPKAYQRELLASIPQSVRMAIHGPHGLGKTTWESWAILWFACTREAKGVDWKIPTTAGSWNQLVHYLWPEIHRWARLLRPEIAASVGIADGKTLLQLNLRLLHGEAFGVASTDAELIEGAHATELLYVFDEAKSISGATWDAAEGAFASAGADTLSNAYSIAASTPGEPKGRFYDICRKASGYEDWKPRHVTKDEAIAAGQMSRLWADNRRRQWGATNPIYLNRVEGEFAGSGADTVIPLAWVEAAQQRWLDWKAKGGDPGPMDAVGVDVGRGGNQTALAPRHGQLILEIRTSGAVDTMQGAGMVVGLLEKWPGAIAIIDVLGIGAGMLDRVREQGYRAHAFNAGASSPFVDASGELHFMNRRAEIWWRMRELLDPGEHGSEIMLPNDDQLTTDLTEPHWKPTSGGKILVEPKEDITARIGRSTDYGDSVCMAFAPAIDEPKRPYTPAVAGVRRHFDYRVR